MTERLAWYDERAATLDRRPRSGMTCDQRDVVWILAALLGVVSALTVVPTVLMVLAISWGAAPWLAAVLALVGTLAAVLGLSRALDRLTGWVIGGRA